MILACECGVSFEVDPEEGTQFFLCPSCGTEAEVSVDVEWYKWGDEEGDM